VVEHAAHSANGGIQTVNLDIVRTEGSRTNEPDTVGYSRKEDRAKLVISNPEQWTQTLTSTFGADQAWTRELSLAMAGEANTATWSHTGNGFRQAESLGSPTAGSGMYVYDGSENVYEFTDIGSVKTEGSGSIAAQGVGETVTSTSGQIVITSEGHGDATASGIGRAVHREFYFPDGSGPTLDGILVASTTSGEGQSGSGGSASSTLPPPDSILTWNGDSITGENWLGDEIEAIWQNPGAMTTVHSFASYGRTSDDHFIGQASDTQTAAVVTDAETGLPHIEGDTEHTESAEGWGSLDLLTMQGSTGGVIVSTIQDAYPEGGPGGDPNDPQGIALDGFGYNPEKFGSHLYRGQSISAMGTLIGGVTGNESSSTGEGEPTSGEGGGSQNQEGDGGGENQVEGGQDDEIHLTVVALKVGPNFLDRFPWVALRLHEIRVLEWTHDLGLLAQIAYEDARPKSAKELVWKSKGVFLDKQTGFRAELFYNADRDLYALAFAGTDELVDHTSANIPQNFGLPTAQYDHAVAIAETLKLETGGNLILLGHSLGGGMAVSSGIVTELKVTAFNAPGVHANTVRRYGAVLEGHDHLIHHYVTPGEILTLLQNDPLLPIVDRIGKIHMLPVVPGDPVELHGMDAVLRAIKAEIERKKLFLPPYEK
jgi:hypothetical protein